MEQGDLSSQTAAAWRANVEDQIRAAFRRISENSGNKAIAVACGTTASAVTMAYNGERPIPVGWLLGIRSLDRDNELGRLLARLVYGADLMPIPQRTAAQERELLKAALLEFGDRGEEALKRALR